MGTEIEMLKCAQDEGAMYSALLMIEDALETGELAKSFLVFNDDSTAEVLNDIARLMHDKYGIKVSEDLFAK